jgi:hypothetical protein
MIDRAEHDPTVQEIVVALRDTARRRGGVMSPTAEPRSDPERSDGGGRSQRVDSLHRVSRGESAATTGFAALRDGEMQRLLDENRRLNERVVFLLKIIEHDQQMLANERAAALLLAEEQDTVARETRAALEAEWRPILVTLLGMLDRRDREPPSERGVRRYFGGAKTHTRAAGRPGRNDSDEHGYDPNWVFDLIRGADASDRSPTARDDRMPHEPEAPSDEREGSFFLRFFTRITHFR